MQSINGIRVNKLRYSIDCLDDKYSHLNLYSGSKISQFLAFLSWNKTISTFTDVSIFGADPLYTD